MKAEVMKENFAKNLKFLRLSKNLSQEKLGKMLGYSDKSVSKWECGDVMPDVFTLQAIADEFHVSLTDLLHKEIKHRFHIKLRHGMNALIVLFGVYALAGLLFFILSSFTSVESAWMVFVYALPIYSIVLIVFSAVFFDYRAVIFSVSLLSWTFVATMYLQFLPENYYFLFVVVGLLQVVYLFLGAKMSIHKKNQQLKMQINA